MDKLTQKQYDFTVNYIKNGFNAYQAALEAGYSDNYARFKAPGLINHPSINNRITKAYQQVEIEERRTLCMTIRDKAKVLDRIIRAVVPLDESQPVNMKFANEAIKAISELNKMQGDYAPDKRLSITVDATKDRLLEARKQYEEY